MKHTTLLRAACFTVSTFTMQGCGGDSVRPLVEMLERNDVREKLSEWVLANVEENDSLRQITRLEPAGNPGRYTVETAFDWSLFGGSVHGNEIKILGTPDRPIAVAFYFEENVTVIYKMKNADLVKDVSGLYADLVWVSDRIGFHTWGRD